jgi:hypothetical protein
MLVLWNFAMVFFYQCSFCQKMSLFHLVLLRPENDHPYQILIFLNY